MMVRSKASDEPATMRIVRAVARARDVDPTALTPPLGTVVDPDALEAVAGADADVAVQFTYAGCRVTVTDGDVSVTAVEEEG